MGVLIWMVVLVVMMSGVVDVLMLLMGCEKVCYWVEEVGWI